MNRIVAQILVVSPHFDDAVLSCPGLLQRAAQRGHEVHVLTIFSEGDASARKRYDIRRTEDKVAIESLHARSATLGFHDAPFRDGWNEFGLGPILAPTSRHLELRNKIELALLGYLKRLNPAVVIAPTGIGWHVDHLLTYELACAVVPGEQLYFYEDKPYAFVQSNLQLRLNPRESLDFETYWEEFSKASFARGMVGELNSERFEAAWKSHLAASAPLDLVTTDRLTLSSAETAKTSEAIQKYSTEWSWLFTNEAELATFYSQTDEVYRSKAGNQSLENRGLVTSVSTFGALPS